MHWSFNRNRSPTGVNFVCSGMPGICLPIQLPLFTAISPSRYNTFLAVPTRFLLGPQESSCTGPSLSLHRPCGWPRKPPPPHLVTSWGSVVVEWEQRQVWSHNAEYAIKGYSPVPTCQQKRGDCTQLTVIESCCGDAKKNVLIHPNCLGDPMLGSAWAWLLQTVTVAAASISSQVTASQHFYI